MRTAANLTSAPVPLSRWGCQSLWASRPPPQCRQISQLGPSILLIKTYVIPGVDAQNDHLPLQQVTWQDENSFWPYGRIKRGRGNVRIFSQCLLWCRNSSIQSIFPSRWCILLCTDTPVPLYLPSKTNRWKTSASYCFHYFLLNKFRNRDNIVRSVRFHFFKIFKSNDCHEYSIFPLVDDCIVFLKCFPKQTISSSDWYWCIGRPDAFYTVQCSF